MSTAVPRRRVCDWQSTQNPDKGLAFTRRQGERMLGRLKPQMFSTLVNFLGGTSAPLIKFVS